jgi:hypothetical protein
MRMTFYFAGGQERDLKRLMGWRSDTMLERYGASAADHRAREAARRFETRGQDMSRRQKTPAGTDVMYGLLKLKCPVGHELGAILRTRHNVYRMTTDQLATFKKDEQLQDAELVTPGQPVRGICPICKQEGRTKYCSLSRSFSMTYA